MDGGPLLLQPALKVKVWGGRKLEAAGIPLPDAQPYGEAWVMHDSATVPEDPLAESEVVTGFMPVPRVFKRSRVAGG